MGNMSEVPGGTILLQWTASLGCWATRNIMVLRCDNLHATLPSRERARERRLAGAGSLSVYRVLSRILFLVLPQAAKQPYG